MVPQATVVTSVSAPAEDGRSVLESRMGEISGRAWSPAPSAAVLGCIVRAFHEESHGEGSNGIREEVA